MASESHPQLYSPTSSQGCLFCGSNTHIDFSSLQVWKLQAVRWLWKLSPSLSGFLFLLIKMHLTGSQFGRKPGKEHGESGLRSMQQTWETLQGKSFLKNLWKNFGRVKNRVWEIHPVQQHSSSRDILSITTVAFQSLGIFSINKYFKSLCFKIYYIRQLHCNASRFRPVDCPCQICS